MASRRRCLFICPEGGIYTFKYALSHGIKTRLVRGDTTIKNGDKGKEKDMEFLKEILGEELFKQFTEKINAHNGNEANKENQIKIGNLGSGEYVGKGKYDADIKKLNDLIAGKDTELTNANTLIGELQKATKGDADLQGKISAYEKENADLQEQLQETERKYAFDLLLMDSGVTDKDEREFLTYKYESKLKEDGKTIELDENKHIKGADGIVASLKTMRPKAFESGTDGKKVFDEDNLPGGNGEDKPAPKNLAEALRAEFENQTE